MTTVTLPRKGRRGCSSQGDAGAVLTPERLSDEHRLIAHTAASSPRKKWCPASSVWSRKDWTLRVICLRAPESSAPGRRRA